MENPYQLQSRRDVYRNRWIYLREDNVTNSCGPPATFAVVEMKAGSSVLALNSRKEVYLMKEFKYAVARASLEVISGGIEESESPLAAAKRELKEEAGLSTQNWVDLGKIDPFTSVISSPNYMFLALDVQEGESTPEEGEILELVKLPFDRVIEMVMSGEITHAASCVLVLKAARYLEQHG
jgi:8-oxo-dGTP pyrophosphatase MutT (NUDIX family)